MWQISPGGTLLDLKNGQTMHSSIGAWEEARQVYVAQSDLEGLAARSSGPVVIYDIGMGVAANPLAFLESWRERGNPRPVRIVSFESEPEALRFALGQMDSFPYLSRWADALDELLANDHCLGDGWSWELRRGDFQNAALGPAPELIYFDFYAPKACEELWTREIFRKLRESTDGQPCRMITYSAATRVRAAMLESGWLVGVGAATSAKAETTLASTKRESLRAFLGHDWLERRPELKHLEAHPQFQSLTE